MEKSSKPGNNVDAIAQHAETDGDRIAVIFGQRKITYGQFNTDIISAAAWLKTEGMHEGMLLGVFMPKNSYWEWVVFHAAYRLGLTHVTLSPAFNGEIQAIGKVDAVICPVSIKDSALVGRQLTPYSPQSIRTRFPLDIAQNILRTMNPAASKAFQRLALTSGTTGSKKAVLWSSTILKQRVAKVAEINKLSNHTHMSSLFKMDTTAGLRYPLATWQMGGTALFSYIDTKSQKRLSPILQSSFLVLSPFQLQRLFKAYPGFWTDHSMRKIVVAGGRLPAKVREYALKYICHSISISYGSTETGSVFMGDSSLIDRHAGAVGFLVSSAEAQIVDEHDLELPRGMDGMIRTKTPYMVHKYESTSAPGLQNSFKDGWFYSGDQGVLFEDGMLAISGRINDTINISGRKISVLDLESRIIQLDGILDVCVVKLDLSNHDSLGVAIVTDTGLSASSVQQQQVLEACRKIPFLLFTVDDIPRNSTGKVARLEYAKKLLAILHAQPSSVT